MNYHGSGEPMASCLDDVLKIFSAVRLANVAGSISFSAPEARGESETMSVDTSATHDTGPHTTLDPRTQRALDESMTVTASTHKPGAYHVAAASGVGYTVTLPTETDDLAAQDSATCTCPDHTSQTPEQGCKHLRRVKLDIAFGELPQPDDWPSDTELAEREPSRPEHSTHLAPSSVAADGGQVLATNSSGTPVRTSPKVTADEPAVTTSIPAEGGVKRGGEGDEEEDTPLSIAYRISERIQEIEYEIDQRRAELKDLECCLSVLENLVPEMDPSKTSR